MSGDLVTFLRARLDEEHEVAQREYAYPNGAPVDWDHVKGEADSMLVGIFSPARVLAEVAAKRALLTAMIGPALSTAVARTHDAGLATARFLAMPYAQHPEYRSEWAP